MNGVGLAGRFAGSVTFLISLNIYDNRAARFVLEPIS